MHSIEEGRGYTHINLTKGFLFADHWDGGMEYFVLDQNTNRTQEAV